MEAESQFLPLPDGRRLAYLESGRTDGQPVFLFHGMPGSRYFFPANPITTRLGVRLITLDRPGYGQSSFQPGRCLLDWPADIARLADRLGLERFHVAAHSGGGPYAAACAWALPERVRAAAIVCGAGPYETASEARELSPFNRFGLTKGRYIPWPAWRLLIWTNYHLRAADPAADMLRGSRHRPAADEALITQPEVRQACLQSELEAFRPGLRGLAWDARLLTRPWGFRLEEIRLPVQLWYGTADNQVPASMGRALAGRIPGSRLILCPGEGHLLIFPRWEEILTSLLRG
jgi:pimeloyl-ACP methyl ester carboxylesterase